MLVNNFTSLSMLNIGTRETLLNVKDIKDALLKHLH